jgi:hypothetical protein
MEHRDAQDTQHAIKPNVGPAVRVIPKVQHKLESGIMANIHEKALHSGPDQRVWYGVVGGSWHILQH